MATKVIESKITIPFLSVGVVMQKPDDWSLNQIFLSICGVVDCDPHEGNQTCRYAKTPFRYSRSIILITKSLKILDYQDFDAMINFNSFSYESSSTGVKLSHETLIDELIRSCWENWVRTMSCIHKDGIFQNFRTMGIVTHDTKLPIFQSSTLLQVELFWLRPNWNKLALYSWRKVSCNIEEIQY